ncbi:MAG: hypothetical protein QXH27_03850 [Candidatus Micrarchaeia archaeon]
MQGAVKNTTGLCEKLNRHLFAAAAFLTVSWPGELDENAVKFFGAAALASAAIKTVSFLRARAAEKRIRRELSERVLCDKIR